MRYSADRERIVLSGLAEVGNVRLAELDSVVRRRKRACSGSKMQYGWLRIDPCANLPHTVDESAPVLTSPRSISMFLHEVVGFSGRGVSYSMVLCMNAAQQPMAVAVPHKGRRASAVFDQAVVLQAAILSGASDFVVAHNFESPVVPNAQDVETTRRIAVAASHVGLKFRDRLILTDDPEEFASFANRRLL